MTSPYEDLVAGGRAHQREARQKLVTFTEADCKVLVEALTNHVQHPLTDPADLARINRLIERLS